jgi:serine/threonine protein kinase
MSTPTFFQRPDPYIGRVLKETYHLDRRLSDNGMGAVYLGTDLNTDRTVAVKTLHGLAQANAETCTRFFHEARILSKLNHPNIVGLLDFDFTPEGLPFVVMEYMEGCTLDAFVPPEGLPFATVLPLMEQLLKGVGAAHDAKLIHRDLAPFNLFVADPSGTPTIKVLNFGVAKALNDSGAKTFGSDALGNPNYMSPEHFRNFEGMDARADIFSLGSILHFMITGQEAFPGTSFSGVMSKILAGQKPASIDFEALGKPECAVLEPTIRRAMSPDPALRFASAEEMLAHLSEAVGKLPGLSTRTTSIARLWRHPRMRSVASFAMGASPLLVLTGGFLAWQFLHQAENEPSLQPPPQILAAEGASDPTFLSFQDQLRTAVKARDAHGLLALISPSAQIGVAQGRDALIERWHPELADSALWAELDALVTLPGRFPQANRFEVSVADAKAPASPDQLRLAATKSAEGVWRIDHLM